MGMSATGDNSFSYKVAPSAGLLKRSREEGAPIDPRVDARRGEDGDDVSCRHDYFHVPVLVDDEAATPS
jgi:hypothetical protein